MGDLRKEAWELLDRSIVEFEGRPIGTMAATDREAPKLNYDQIFVRDFAVSAFAFLLRGEGIDVVRNFLETTLELQSDRDGFDCFQPGKGLLPASYRPEPSLHGGLYLEPDYGEESIARVTPVDSVFWWLLVLHAYEKATGDTDFAEQEKFQKGIHLILELVLEARFEMWPTLLVPDGSFMIDRRMGVYGRPLEVQALMFAALRAAEELLDEHEDLLGACRKRLPNLSYYIRENYWIDADRMDRLRSSGVEQYGDDVANAFNIHPDSIPDWAQDWLPEGCGYFAGNLGPGRLDYRFFSHGNLLSATCGLATDEQSRALLDLYDGRWDELAGEMPFKLVYPAYEERDWRTITGADPKNRPWSYHNGGSWPFLLGRFAMAAAKHERLDLIERALEAAERRLSDDRWPEYYAGRCGENVGDQARRFQTWSVAGYLTARELLEHPEKVEAFSWEPDIKPQPC